MTLEDHLGCLPRRSSGAMGGFGRLGATKGDRGRRIWTKIDSGKPKAAR